MNHRTDDSIARTTSSIPVYGALLEEDDIGAVAAAMRRGWLGIGADVASFESAIAETIGAADRYPVAVSTGGAALHVAALIAGCVPGDEVIVPSLCHLSNVQAILATGAVPVFCDVDQTMCIDPDRIVELIGPRTKAIMALDYGCNICDHDFIGTIAIEHHLRVIHDAAHSFGSSNQGRPIGTFTDICMFSFDPVKCLTAVDAGVLMLRTPEEARTVREIRILGSDQPEAVMYKNARTWDYDAVRIGYRYHLSNIHAALGLSQLAKLDRIRINRQRACEAYSERLKANDLARIPAYGFDSVCPFLYAIRVPCEQRDALRVHLSDAGIDTGVHWRPAHNHEFFRQFRCGPLPTTERAARELISLPLHSAPMCETTIDRICDLVTRFLR